MMFEENSFGNVLKSFRDKKGKSWTQERTADLLGVSRRTYAKWEDENEKHIPSPKYLKEIVALFELSEEDRDKFYLAAAQVPPVVHTIPLQKNPFFTGREAQLKQLKQYLEENGKVAITQPISISGLGGIGKTQLALEYAHQSYQTLYRAVFWVNAADETTLRADYDELAHLLGLPEGTEREPDRGVKAVKTWLEGHKKWLLILDNADDLQLVNSFMPVMPRGHIILTTRSQIVRDSNIAIQIEIEEMELEEGLLFLLLRSGILPDKTKLNTVASDVRDSAIELVTLLGGHPLALDQAGAYIEEARVLLADYIQIYREARQDLLNRRGSLGSPSRKGEHPQSVATTFELSFNKACKQHPMAADILYFCSFLQPDAIPEELLQQDDDLRIDKKEFNEGIAALQRYSLIKRNAQERIFSMHRLVQAVLLDTMALELKERWEERIIRALNKAFPEVEFREWSKCGRLIPHVMACASWTEYESTTTPELSGLLQKAGVYLRERGQFVEAEPLLGRALSIREQQLGAEHLDTAISASNLATLYRLQGRYDLAEQLYERALSIFKKQLGAEHPHTMSGMSNLAELYRNLGKYEEAESLCQQALTLRDQHLGADHPDTAKSLSILANLYWEQRRYDLAEPLYVRALSIFEQQLGAEHPDTATSMNNMAEFYWHQGKYEKAETLYERVLAIREEHLGAEHPGTARSLHGLANLSRDQGKHERAEALYQRALSIQEQQLGSTHPHTKETRNDYIAFLRSSGRDSEADAIKADLS